ncbi:sialate O-acetylesterase [Glutamicibacter mysorens]|uniref:sialate O-acetylesterase n=1 Tax=Glutamicibacter mysorens TaxID=257984 RepID=UPI0020C65210|nr:sialate O-acetylesterase [Glutamicibacter mysorens]UTM47042.1 sialate O-acetylesterase [Glutamicibacter mysorens]
MKRTNTVADALNTNLAQVDPGDGLPVIPIPLDGKMPGYPGPPGPGVPEGGTTGQLIEKTSDGSTRWVDLTKSKVGLGNVDNTSDQNKPISEATQTALNAKASKIELDTKADLVSGKIPVVQIPVEATVTDANVAAQIDAPQTGAAIDARINAEVAPQVEQITADYIASDQAVIDAAVAAVDANPKIKELEAADEAIDGLRRDVQKEAPRRSSDDSFRILDETGAAALEITPQGNTHIGSTRIEHLDDETFAYRIRDKSGAVAFQINSDGTVDGGSGGGTQITDVHLVIGAGQSNMSGRGTPSGAFYDPVDSRIYQFGSGASSITPAGVPLDMHDTPTGLSPLTVFAREYARKLGPGHALLLVPAAHGGTGFTTAAPLTWTSTVTGGLYDDMIAQATAAVAAAQNLWGITPSVDAFLWHQGEADGSMGTASYATAFDALVSKVRADLAEPSLPVIVGQMSSDWVAGNAGPLSVQAAHKDTPARVEYSAFADSAPDTGRHNDLVHFGREGVEYLGRTMADALDRARANQSGLSQMPPTGLRTVKAGGVVTARWEQPLCRVTGYEVEWTTDGTTWTAIASRPIAAETSQEIPATATQVRVATITPAGNSRFTQPALVEGA